MKAKIPLLVGGAVGYVLGTRAGRERYEQIKSQAQTLWNNPKVQEKAWAAQDFAKEKAPILKDKVADAAPGGTSSSGPGTTSYSSTGPLASPAATDPDPDPLGDQLDDQLGGPLGTDPLDPDPLATDPLAASSDPLSNTPDDRAPFPSSGSGL